MLICDVKKALPNIKIVLLEPFVMLGSGTESYYEAFAEDVKKRQHVCEKVAQKYSLSYVLLQKKLEDLAARCSAEYVLYDGVHPTFAGHAVISEALYEALAPIL